MQILQMLIPVSILQNLRDLIFVHAISLESWLCNETIKPSHWITELTGSGDRLRVFYFIAGWTWSGHSASPIIVFEVTFNRNRANSIRYHSEGKLSGQSSS